MALRTRDDETAYRVGLHGDRLLMFYNRSGIRFEVDVTPIFQMGQTCLEMQQEDEQSRSK